MRHLFCLTALVLGTSVAAPALAAQEPDAAAPAADTAETAAAGGVRLDFQNADIRLVISALAEAAGINVVYSNLPDRRVTLRMARPVAPEKIPALLRSIAESNGLTVTRSGSFLRIEGTSRRTGARGRGRRRAREAPPEAGLRLYVYRLKHAKAGRLASTLQAIFGGGRARGSASGPSGGGMQPLSLRLEGQGVPPGPPGSRPEVDVQMSGQSVPTLPGELSGEVQIVPDEATNSLLVRCKPRDWRVIRQAIGALDLRPMQVLIEVVIAEVRNTRDEKLGVSTEGAHEVGTPGTLLRGGLSTGAVGSFILEAMQIDGLDLNVALSALSSRGEVRILSRPVILAQNNQKARIMIGAERPFIQVFRSLPTEGAVRDQIVQYRDVGTSLTIVPTINPDGYVNLHLVQEVSTATNEVQFGAPVISTREISTHLFLKDGQTAVLGGLVDRQRTTNRSGIPILKDIPLLGALFRSSSDVIRKSELFVFLTPHIIESDADANRVREEIEGGAIMLEDMLPVAPLVPRPRAAPTVPDSMRADSAAVAPSEPER